MSTPSFPAQTPPRCQKPTRLASSEPHPTRDDVTLHTYHCESCGPVTTIVESRREERAEYIAEIDYERTLACVSRVMASA